MEMEMDFPSTHTGCKRRSQSGVTLPGNTRNNFAATAKLLQPTLAFPSGLLSLPSPLQPACVSIFTTERDIYSIPSPPGTLQRDTHKLWCL